MTYAQRMLAGDAAERCKKWDEAADHYTAALRSLLFGAMLPVWSPTVKGVQERRFNCWRRIQSAGRSV
jgi:hypothetical protein